MSAAGYPPIEDYGLIGDCRTAALVSSTGSIDWMCLPDFDGPAIFGRLLDARRGGHFSIRPAAAFESRMDYVEESAVLRTTFRTASGLAALTDFMPLVAGDGAGALATPGRQPAARAHSPMPRGENLAAAGDHDEAAKRFESLLARATPLGLLAEELAPGAGQRGNFPQALTLLALVNAAVALEPSGRRRR